MKLTLAFAYFVVQTAAFNSISLSFFHPTLVKNFVATTRGFSQQFLRPQLQPGSPLVWYVYENDFEDDDDDDWTESDSENMVDENLSTDEDMIRHFARYSLKGMHEYEDVEYIGEKDNGFYCKLCDTLIFNKDKVPEKSDRTALFVEHVHSLRHETRYFQLSQGQKLYVYQARVRRLKRVSGTLHRISNVKSDDIKAILNDLAWQFVDTPLGTNGIPPKVEEERRWKALMEKVATL